MSDLQTEIAIVGGGLTGCVLAATLRSAGHEVVVFERAPAWRWRAGGVFTSPAAVTALRQAGLDENVLQSVARPIPAMRVETPAGTSFRLTYGADTGGASAVGFDRSRLDPALLELARSRGVEVRSGSTVTSVDPATGRLVVRDSDGSSTMVRAAVIVGADGRNSIVARAAGVARSTRLAPRIGLTYHLADPDPAAVRDARMCLLADGYVGIAPVAGGRVNVGIVLGRTWRSRLSQLGAEAVAAAIVSSIPATADDPLAWREGTRCDAVAGAWPLGHRVTRRAGPGWLLVGDAAGFLDPFTGEGIHRGLVSAGLAARAIHAQTRGEGRAFGAYERAMQRRFVSKDIVSGVVQLFLARPVLFEYAARRLAARPAARATMGLVIGDLVGAGRVLDPRYLATLLAP